MKDYNLLREQMVEHQIVSRGVKDDRVLASMLKVPRHLFVDENMQDIAYSDQPIPVGAEQTISQPYMVALMTNVLRKNSATDHMMLAASIDKIIQKGGQ